MYQLRAYLHMLRDPTRMDAIRETITQLVRPGDLVLDLGASVGALSLLALEAGARHVIAIDISESVHLAKELAAHNGYADRITCIQADSTELTLPEQADVLLADLRGTISMLENSLQVTHDARVRLCKPEARMMPLQDTLFAALVDFPEGFAEIEGWRQLMPPFQFDFLTTAASNQWCRKDLRGEHLLSEPQELLTIDYRQPPPRKLRWKGEFHVKKAGMCNGITIWFRAHLTPSISYETHPAGPPTVYGQAFFPFEHAHPVTPGERIPSSLKAQFLNNKAYAWFWNASFDDAREQHSSLEGQLLSPTQLEKCSAQHVASLNVQGQLEHTILSHMAQQLPLGEIATRLMEQFPSTFPSWEDALGYVGKRSLQYSS